MHRSASILHGLAPLFVATTILAGPNEGGTLILHFDPTVTSCEIQGCPPLNIADCADALVRVDDPPICPVGMWVLAAFSAESSPRLAAVAFGWSYDPEAIVLGASLSCAEFELPTSNWPAPGEGTAVVWSPARTEHLVPVYWFYAYLYEGAPPSVMTLTPHPVQGATFADDSIPALLDEVAALGALGFGTDGLLPCPGGLGVPGACCFPDVTCEVMAELSCEQQGGFFQGSGTTCDPNPCVHLEGACCTPSSGCVFETSEWCAAHGEFQGIGVTCDPDPCPTSTGACCVELQCQILSATDCTNAGGGFLGDGEPCDPDPCAYLTGCGAGFGGGDARDGDGVAVLGFGNGIAPESPASEGDLTLLIHADGTYENGGAFRGGAQARPWFGAFAEGYQGDYEVHAAVFDFAQTAQFSNNNMDVYLWTDEGGCPGAVACLRLDVDPGPIADWPDVSRHLVELAPCCPGATWWVGFWGDWPGAGNHWFALFDQTASTEGNPMVCARPFLGYPDGWTDVAAVFGSQVRSNGIGAYVRDCDPVPIVETSWGRIKALYKP